MKQFRTFLAAFLIKDILNFSQGCILWLYMYANGAGLFFIWELHTLHGLLIPELRFLIFYIAAQKKIV